MLLKFNYMIMILYLFSLLNDSFLYTFVLFWLGKGRVHVYLFRVLVLFVVQSVVTAVEVCVVSVVWVCFLHCV